MKSVLFSFLHELDSVSSVVDVGLERGGDRVDTRPGHGVLLPFLFAPFKQGGNDSVYRACSAPYVHTTAAEDGNFFKSQPAPVISTLGRNSGAIAGSQLVKLNFDARRSRINSSIIFPDKHSDVCSFGQISAVQNFPIDQRDGNRDR